MAIDIPLPNDDKLAICTAVAKRIIKQKINRGHPLDELVNEGYIHITTHMPGKAYVQARMYMLQLINRAGIGKRVEATRKTPNPETDEMQVFVDVDKRYPKVGILRDGKLNGISLDDMIDVKDAINSLSTEEWELIQERFVSEFTFKQIAKRHCKKHSTSIKFQVDKILLKLKGWLSR